MANLGYVSSFNINGNELSLKDAALTEIVDEIIQAIGANNTNIAERINDLHNRSFDNTIKISSVSESEIANIQDGLYKIQYVTVTGSGDNETETLNNSAILIQKGANQYLYKDGQISSRTKTNSTWGTWVVDNHPVTSVNGMTGAVSITIPDAPVTSVNGMTGAVTISHPVTSTKQSKINYITGSPEPNGTAFGVSTSQYIHFDTGDFNVNINSSNGHLYFNTNEVALKNDIKVSSVNGATGAVTVKANVQSDWNATSGDAVILNKPTIPTVPTTSTTVTENDNNPVSGGAVYAKFEDLIGSAPAALDTLGEIAAALNNDADLAGTLTNQISGKISKVSPATAGNFAALNSDGTLVDSGHKHSDYLTSQTQADWNETNTSSAAYINNKPTIPTVPTNISTFINDSGYITASSLVQSDWNQSTTTASDYIKNKPDIRTDGGQTYIGENSYVRIGNLANATYSTIDVTNFLISLRSQNSNNNYSYNNITGSSQNAYFYSTYNNNQRTISKRTQIGSDANSYNMYNVFGDRNSYITLYTDEYVDQNLNAYVGFTFQGINNNELTNSYYKFEPSHFTLSTKNYNDTGTGTIRLSSYNTGAGTYWMAINGERVPKLSDIQTSLSSNYATSTDTNDDLLLATGDTFEQAFGKLEKAILDNSEVAATAIQEVTSNMVTSVNGQSGDVILNIPEVPVTSVNGMTGAVNISIPSKTSDLTNDSGFLTTAPVTSVNGQTGVVSINVGVTSFNGVTGAVTYTAPVTSVNGQTGAVTLALGDTNVIETVKVNNTALTPVSKAVNITVPTKTSDLTNDSGFITSAPVTSVNNQTGAVTLALGDTNVIETVKVNNTALTPVSKAVNITVPTKTSDLTNDSGFITSAPVTSVNGQTGAVTVKANVQSDWNATSGDAVILNKPTIPTVNNSTVTITMNGATVGTFTLNKSGNTTINLGTVLTEHQSIKTINNQTITGSGNVDISGLPTVTSADNGKVLMVVNGAWQLVSPVTLYSGSGTPANSQGNNGDLYVQS